MTANPSVDGRYSHVDKRYRRGSIHHRQSYEALFNPDRVPRSPTTLRPNYWTGSKLLQAIIHNKAPASDIEDEISSTIFGSLRYVEPKPLFRLLTSLWAIDPPSDACTISRTDVNLWPNLAAYGRIEPDLVIDFLDDEDALVLKFLIEVKWRAPTKLDQLIEQWKALGAHAHNCSRHIYLVFDRRSVDEQIKKLSELDDEAFSRRKWKRRLSISTWGDFADNLERAARENGPLKRWAEDVKEYLQRLKVFTFQGFTFTKEYPNLAEDSHASSAMFWRPFAGFCHLKDYDIAPPASNDVLFWSGP